MLPNEPLLSELTKCGDHGKGMELCATTVTERQVTFPRPSSAEVCKGFLPVTLRKPGLPDLGGISGRTNLPSENEVNSHGSEYAEETSHLQ